MLRVLNCAIRGPEICDLDGLNAFQNFAVQLVNSLSRASELVWVIWRWR